METTAVDEILSWLSTTDLKNAASTDIESRLIKLKELTRNKDNALSLYTSAGFLLLYRLAFASESTSLVAADEAKRCLANALTLEDHCVSIFLETDGLNAVLTPDTISIGSCSFLDEFLYARILFLVTGKRGPGIKTDIEKHGKPLSKVLSQWLSRHWLWASEHKIVATSDISESSRLTALAETLKLCFNISLYCPQVLLAAFPIGDHEDAEIFIHTLISSMLNHPDEKSRVIIPHLINLLTTVADTKTNTKSVSAYANLFQILNKFVDAMLDRVYWDGLQISEDQMIPLLTVLSNAYSSFESNPEAQDYIKARLLVPSSERAVPLGRSDSHQARLLRLMNTAGPRTRDCISTLLYQVSDSVPTRFVENVGYGHAIGFLTSKGIALAPDEIPAEYAGKAINPITGQNIRDEEYEQAQKGLSDMTEEEKEREAERLFVLFERLKKNGIIDVKNPIQQAVDEGRFQEM